MKYSDEQPSGEDRHNPPPAARRAVLIAWERRPMQLGSLQKGLFNPKWFRLCFTACAGLLLFATGATGAAGFTGSGQLAVTTARGPMKNLPAGVSDETSGETDWSTAIVHQLAGRVESCQAGRICIVGNRQSRSKISYYVYGPLISIIAGHVGKYIQVTGRIALTDAANPFKRAVFVDRILHLSKDPDPNQQ
jgi:hypothetical protein